MHVEAASEESQPFDVDENLGRLERRFLDELQSTVDAVGAEGGHGRPGSRRHELGTRVETVRVRRVLDGQVQDSSACEEQAMS